jgi:PAS domain S-box-containing protein
MEHANEHFPLIDMVPIGLIYLNENQQIIQINKFAQDKLFFSYDEVVNKTWDEVFPHLLNQEIQSKTSKILQFTFANERFIAHKEPYYVTNYSSGTLLVFQPIASLDELTEELDSYKNLALDLKAIFDSSYDVIYVSDGEGLTLRVSTACERLWGYKESDLVGKSVYQLESEGVFNPSVTRLVLEKKEKVSMIQTTKTGRRLMVIGTPIKNDEGKIIRVVNASSDVTEVKQLESQIDLLKQITEGYRQEIQELRAKDELEKKIIYRSEQMGKVVTFSQKIAKVDSTVLLLGEAGVGKEVIASFIHKWSSREKNPFIVVNCGSMPEKLLELELFGDEEESLNRQMGAIEMANEGTLFLNEVEDLPARLQSKLLRVIQGEQLLKSGGNNRKVNLRIIAASNNELERRVKEGSFRGDLYYQLNVIPIYIPSLRERKEDIIPLIMHFSNQLNAKYMDDKKFQPRLLKELQEYSWPGNVRELHNIIERLFVTSEGVWIGFDHLPEHIKLAKSRNKGVFINKIMPLKEAVDLVEKELLELAEKKYGSTTKMAEVLGVNQSTISRKLQKYKQ